MSLTYNYLRIEETTYAFTSQGSGQALVLLHGFTGSSETWQPFIDAWKEEFQVVTIDLPGHGKTMGESNLSMSDVCRHLTLLLAHLSIEKCHLLGYSMGGRTALSFAMWYPLYVDSLLLESASPGLRTTKEQLERVEKDTKLAERIRRDGVEEFVDFWEAIPLFSTQQKLPQRLQQRIREERLQQSVEGLATSLTSVGTGTQPSWWSALRKVKQPVCLIVGKDDEKFVQINDQMAKEFVHSECYLVPNAGHAVHIEQPDDFAHIVQRFIHKNNMEKGI